MRKDGVLTKKTLEKFIDDRIKMMLRKIIKDIK